jgi:hypothetical protein
MASSNNKQLQSKRYPSKLLNRRWGIGGMEERGLGFRKSGAFTSSEVDPDAINLEQKYM